MAPRIKKLIALAILLPGLLIYFLAVAALADWTPDHRLVRGVYYLIVGVAWAYPVMHLLRWADRAPPAQENRTKMEQ
ncbi:MAG: DUF2842 domain-containing protein [Pseudomonadota bacterium]